MKITFAFLLVFSFLFLSLISAESLSLTNTKTIISQERIEVDDFTLEVKTSEDIKWEKEGNSYTPIYKDDTKYDITLDPKTQKEIKRNLKPIPEIIFNVNKLSERTCTDSFFETKCETTYWDFSLFESKNNITNKTISGNHPDLMTCIWDTNIIFIWQLRDCLSSYESYDITYQGQIIDLDPSLEVTITSTSDIIFYNKTEGTALGARLHAPVLFMNFDKINESRYVQDNSIYNNFGQLGNTTTSTHPTYNLSCGSSGVHDLGGCYEFDGVNDMISISDDDSQDMTGKITVSAWFNAPVGASTDYPRIISKQDGSGNYPYLIAFDNAHHVRFLTYTDSGVSSISTSTYNDNTWHFVAGTYDGSTQKLYVDGVEVDSDSQSGNLDTISKPLIIGAGLDGTDWFFNGSLDQVQIWDRVLSPSEVLNLYNGTTNNTNYIGKYASNGDFKSLVFYNATSTYWNTTFSVADYKVYGENIGANPDSNGLVSFWKLDGDATDETGANDGSASITGYGESNGVVGQGGEFDNSDDYINCSGGSNLDMGSGDLTVCAWFKSPDNDDMIFQKGRRYADGKRYNLYINTNNKLGSNFDDDSTSTILLSSSLVNDDTWHFGCTQRDSNTMRIFVDGIEENSTDISGLGSLDDSYDWCTIGIANSDAETPTELPFNGSIDEVRLYNRSISTNEIQELYREGLGVKYNLSDDNLVSYWSLDGHYEDLIGGNDGTATGTNNATGISSGAVRFDGVDDYIDVGTSPLQEFNAITMSICAWIYASDSTSDGTYSTLVDTSALNPLGNNGFYLILDDRGSGSPINGVRLDIGTATNSPERVDSNDNIIGDLGWYHICGTYGDSSGLIYVNGVNEFGDLANDGSGDFIPRNANMAIGSGSDSAGNHFNGSIDEVLIYNKTLSSSEVKDLYKAGLTQHANANITLETRTATSYNISDAGLVGFWGLNGDATDETGNNDGSASITGYGESSGVVGQGGEFDGVDDLITITDDSSLTSTPITISTWAKVDSISGTGAIIMKDHEYYILSSSGDIFQAGVSFTGTTFNSINFVTIPSSVLGEWHYFTLTFDGSNARVYLDGVLENTTAYSGTIQNTGNDLGIGEKIVAEGGVALPFDGLIDEVRIYNRSLSASEIKNLYELGNYHIEWSEWNETTGTMEDLVAKTSTNEGNFFQFKSNFNSDDTDVSPYILNSSVGHGEDPTPIGDSTPPTFTYIPANVTLEFATDTLGVNFTGTDETEFDTYAINDTGNFSINATGWLTNVSVLPVGIYTIEVTINDTSENTNSTTYRVNVSDTTAPTCVLKSITPSDMEENTTGKFEMIVTCTDASGMNNTKAGDHYRAFFSITVDSNGSTPNYWSAFYPDNNLSVSNGFLQQIFRAVGRNEGYWYEDEGIAELDADIHSYAVYDGEYGYFKIENSTATTTTYNISGQVEPMLFKSSFPLNKEAMYEEVKKEYELYKKNDLMVLFYDISKIKGEENYTLQAFGNFNYTGTPNKDMRIWYCNQSYLDVTCGGDFTTGCSTKPQNDDDYCVYLNALPYTAMDTRAFTKEESSYVGPDTYGVINGMIGGIQTTNISYIYYRSRTDAVFGKYTIRYVNGTSNTDVLFNESGLAFSTTNGGADFTQLAGTVDAHLNSISSGDQLQLGGCNEDVWGNQFCSFNFYSDDIGDVNFNIAEPTIGYYHQGICTGAGCTSPDEDLNGTYAGDMTIKVLVAIDPDAIGAGNHTLDLYNAVGTFNYTINASFFSGDDSDVWVTFDTTNVANGDYKMNISVVSTDDNSTAYHLTENNFTIAQSPKVLIAYPTNGSTYTTTQSILNGTITGSEIQDCWYSIDGGVTNSSSQDCSGGTFAFSGVSNGEGVNNWTVYANNTPGGIGSNFTIFTVDLPPTLEIVSPPDSSSQDLTLKLNISCTDTQGVEDIWYSWNGINLTYTEVIPLSLYAGVWTVNAWCNDTIGSVSSASSTFTARDFDTNATTECDAKGAGYGLDGAGNCVLFNQSGSGGTSTNINTCRYKKLAYYNTELTWIRQTNCL